MTEVDDLIKRALQEDEEDLLRQMNDEPGYFKQALSIFRGPLGWVMWVAYVMNIIAFFGFLYCGWHALQAENALSAIKWGIGAAILMNLGLHFKNALGIQWQANRVLREVKRLELRLARMESKE